jgi:hypothetical protein
MLSCTAIRLFDLCAPVHATLTFPRGLCFIIHFIRITIKLIVVLCLYHIHVSVKPIRLRECTYFFFYFFFSPGAMIIIIIIVIVVIKENYYSFNWNTNQYRTNAIY